MDSVSSRQSLSTVDKLGIASQYSTPARTDRGKNYGDSGESKCIGTEIGISSSKKHKIEYDDMSKSQLSESKTKNATKGAVPLVVVSSHRKIMKLANNQAKNQMRMESESGSIWQDNLSNVSGSIMAPSEDFSHHRLLQSTLEQFQQTELAQNFNRVFQNKRLPFKYKTFYYLQRILYSKDVETDIIDFR